jgi:hypothetical protein
MTALFPGLLTDIIEEISETERGFKITLNKLIFTRLLHENCDKKAVYHKLIQIIPSQQSFESGI